jgi:orotate phosphoribosyltransferase
MRADDIRWLRDLMEKKCIERGDFILSSGLPAKYYYDGKFSTLNPSAARVIGRLLLPLVRENTAEAVGGMAVGADPIAMAVALASLEDGGPEIPAFIVRPTAKEHGKKDQISASFAADGKPLLSPGRRVAIVDDVITTGGSVRGAITAAQAAECEVVLVVALVERHERGGARLRGEGYNFLSLFYTDEDGNLRISEELLQSATFLSEAGLLR